MTLWDNGFDLGADGTTANTSTIASSGSAFHLAGSATWKFTAADAIDGARAIEFVRASNTGFASTNYALNTLDVSFSFFFTYKGSVPNANDYLFDARKGTTTTNSSICRMLTNASGIPFVQIGGTTVGTGTTPFTAGQQYRCDVRIHIDASAGSIHVDFYTPYGGSPLFTGFSLTSQTTGTSNIADVAAGPFGANSVTVGTFVLDRPRIDDTQSSSYLGAPTTGHAGSASLVATATLGASTVAARAGAVSLLSTATLFASRTGGVTYNDTRYTYGSLLVTYAGTTSTPTVSLSAPATLSAVNTDTAQVIPVAGVWRTTITKPYGALITITVGGTSAVSLPTVPPAPPDSGGVPGSFTGDFEGAF